MSEFKDFLNESSSSDFKKDLIKLRKKHTEKPGKDIRKLVAKMETGFVDGFSVDKWTTVKDIQRWMDMLSRDADGEYQYRHMYGAKTPEETKEFLAEVKKNIKEISNYYGRPKPNIDAIDAIIKNL